MKIVFTDIDRVLNSAYYTASTGGGISFIEEQKINNLKKIVDETGAVVVVVSRANAFIGKEFDEARINGIKQYGVFSLDSIRDIEFQDSKVGSIRRWLKRNNAEDSAFVVLDDCPSKLQQ